MDMNEDREFYAATVEQAVEKAAADLGVARVQVEFEVLDRGSTGFLGIGARDARILVRGVGTGERIPPAAAPAPPGEEAPEPNLEDREAPPEDPVVAVEQPDATPQAGAEVSSEGDDEEVVLAADEFMTSLMKSMGLDARVDAYDAGEVISVDVSLEETGLFIGQKGETIDAVQYLLNVSVYKNRPFAKRIVVDTGGYRQRRLEAIQGMAHRTARKAQREKRPISLPPMPAAERRVVHVYLKENRGVTTASEGDEENRRVVVSPV